MKPALVCLVFCVACAGAPPRSHLLESATFESEDRYWAVGSSGRAELFENGTLTPWEYPMDPELDAFYYEPAGDVPTASVHVVGKQPYLFTRAGEIFSFNRGWQRFLHRIRPERGDERPQIDHVLVAPGERLFIHVHAQVILEGTLAELASGDYTRSETPTFFTHMDAFGSRLFGIGWDSSGYVRQLYEADGAGFRPLVSLGRDGSDEVRGTLLLDDGSPVAVIRAGLVPALAASDVSVFSGLVDLLPRDPKHVPRTRTDQAGIARVFAPAPGRALLVFEPNGAAAEQQVIELRGQSARAYVCNRNLGSDPIGAFAKERGFRLVTSSGRPIDVPGPDCRERNQVASDPVLEVPK